MTSPFDSGVVGTYPISGNAQIDPLIWLGYKWGASGAGTPAVVTYSFPTASSTWSNDYATFLDNEPFNKFEPFTAAQQTAANQALALWSEVANITFQQVTETPTDVGDIRFGNSASVTQDPNSAAWAYTPYEDSDPNVSYPENGDIWFDKKYSPNLQLTPGKEGFATMLHEIGHALGLDHPFQDDPSDPGEPVLSTKLNTDQYTVMSYTAEAMTAAYASTPQMLDILAIQYIYGANMTTRTGDDVYQFSSTVVNKTIWDAGGNDTLDFSRVNGYVRGIAEGGQTFFVFHPGTASLVGIAYDVTIENIIGGNQGNNIEGNDADNRLIGGNFFDSLTGWGGDDHLEGRGGFDGLYGKSGNNWLDGGAGGDQLYGGDGVDTLLGGSGSDLMYGYESDDFLDGGLGNDTMFGGAGNDTYVISAAGDIINEESNKDTDDVVHSTVTINLTTLSQGAIEHAVLLGAAAINVTGNDKNNQLTGNSGANKLDGGVGADTLTGGNGADIYTVDNVGDKVIETNGAASGGIDTVNSAIDFTLGANVEKLTLRATFGDIDGTGNTLNNTIIGNEGANILDGASGNDTLTGAKGDDTYIVDSLKDVVNETIANNKGGGVDTVLSAVTFSLATRVNIENLTLTGTGDNKGTGNALTNVIEGNSGRNVLDGGLGADTLRGGAGNDFYVVDNAGDKVDEGANTDTGDEVKSNLLIGVFAGIENYTYTGTKAWSFTGTTDNNKASGGSASDTLNGGAGNDTLIGNGGNDLLIGDVGGDWLDGGIGNDKMLGGAGNDTYVINVLTDSINEEGNADTDDVVRSSISISLTSFAGIEHVELIGTAANATGNAGNNKITGNAAANVLIGGAGADTMDGGAGKDKLKGGSGNDTYVLHDATDVIDEESNTDTDDVVRAAINVNLAVLAGGRIEHAILTGTANTNALGNTANNKLTGNDGANELDGGIGADVLTGGLGNDTMIGGDGDDTYVVDAAGDVVSETVAVGGGTDLVESSVDLSLATLVNVENLTLTGSALNGTGNALANTIKGTAASNILVGLGGDDLLDGLGGADLLKGGAGNDTYVLDDAGDVIDEEANTDANDLVRSSTTVNLTALAAGLIEHAELLGAAAINATGNAGDNKLTGNSADNVLDGGGGADTLTGGAGNDTYVVDNLTDQVIETGGGIDLVKAGVTFSLAALVQVENVTPTGVENLTLTGSADINASGNILDNTLTGNGGANLLEGGLGNDILDGLGGADTMRGGLGSDTYLIDDAADVVEDEGDGLGVGDTVQSSNLNLLIGPILGIEHYTYTGAADWAFTGDFWANRIAGGSGNDVLTGAQGFDTLIGGDGDDFLRGGNQPDAMTGGGGRDVFFYDELIDLGDTITDFQLGASGDVLDLHALLDSLLIPDDPFSGGHVSFMSVGGDTIVNIDTNGSAAGGGEVPLVTLQNVLLTVANTDNYIV